MKKFFYLIALVMMCTLAANAQQQRTKEDYKQVIKERQELNKLTGKALEAKKTKVAKAQAKADKKAGWLPLPGEKPLEYQYDEKMRLTVQDEGGLPKYIIGTGYAISRNIQSAYTAATASSRADIAGQFETELDQVIDQSSNDEQRNDEINTLVKAVSEGTQYVSKNLKMVRPVIKMYREKKDDTVEVRVETYCDTDQAKAVLFERLSQENATVREKLEVLIKEHRSK